MGHSGACLRFELSHTSCLQDTIAPKCRMLFLCCPLRSFPWCLGPVVRPAICPQATAGALQSEWCVCGYLSLSPGQGSFGVVLSSVRAAYCQSCGTALEGLWPRAYSRGWICNVHRVRCAVSARFACRLSARGDLSPAERRPAGLEGMAQQSKWGWRRCTVIKFCQPLVF